MKGKVKNMKKECVQGKKECKKGANVFANLNLTDDPEVIRVIVNLIAYSMVRDEYRDYVKENKKEGRI